MPSNRKSRPASDTLADAAALIDVRPPAQELRALVAARVETLAKLGHSNAGGSSAQRLELYRDALGYATRLLADARARPDATHEETMVLPLREGSHDETPPADGSATTITDASDDEAPPAEEPAEPRALSPEEASRLLLGLNEPEIDEEAPQ